MIPQSAPNMYGWILVFLFVSVFLISCHSDNAELKSIEANVTLDDADSLEGETIAPITKEYSHPYLVKADEIRDKEGFEEALAYYEAAVSLFEKEENWEGLVTAKNRISAYYFKVFNFDSLLTNLEATLEFGQKHLESSSLSFSEIQYWFGIYYERTNDPYRAISFQKKALDNRVKQLGSNHLLVAQSLKAIGDTYLYALSDNRSAESYYEQSVDIESKLLDSSDVDLVRGYYAVASAKRLNDDSEGAIIYGLKALKTALMDPEENRQRIGLCHNILANTYNDKNDYKNAEYHYKKAIEISKVNFGENNSDLPIYLNGLGTMYLRMNKLELAQSYLMRSLNINRLHFSDDSDKVANSFVSLGWVYTRLKKYDSAFLSLNKGLEIKLREFGMKNTQTAIVYEFLGDMYADSGQLHMALKNYQKALIGLVKNFEENDILANPEFSSRHSGFRLIHVIAKKAFLLKRQYHNDMNIEFLKASLETYQLASKIIDLKRNNDISEDSRLVLIENYFQDEMENGIDCAFLLYQLTNNPVYQNTAFQMIEKSKYMLLFESLIRNKKNQQFGVPDSLLALENNLKVEMAFFKQNLDKELQNENFDQQRVDQWQNKVFATAIKQEKLYEKLKEDYPNYFNIKFDSVTLSTNEIQKTLKCENTKLIAYYYGKKNIYVISISSETIQFKRLEKFEDLENAIAIYLDQISNSPDVTDPENYRLFCESAFQLHQLLIQPIAPEEEANKNLIIIPHGTLSILPFESIIKSIPKYQKIDYKNLDYLINYHKFSYAYSANLLFKNRIKSMNWSYPKLLAFSYSNELKQQKKKNEIVGSSREINNISKFVKGTYYKGSEATESAFKSIAPQFDIIHLAVHGTANNDSKLSNSLVFKNESDSVNDGILHSYELLNLDLNAKLVVLSACETGLGKRFKGEGIFSIARSFAYAGSESIIMSYWKARDNATADVMGSFYKFLVDGATVNSALQKAKIAYLESAEELTAHPSTWAAFVALGDMTVPIFNAQRGSSKILWYSIFTCMIVLTIFIILKRQKSQSIF